MSAPFRFPSVSTSRLRVPYARISVSALVFGLVLSGCGEGAGDTGSESDSSGAITTATQGQTTEVTSTGSTSATTGDPTGSETGSDSDSSTTDPATDTELETDATDATDATTDDPTETSESDGTDTTNGTSGSQTDGTDSSDTEPWEPVPCQVETTKTPPTPSNLVFVLDKSGSMTNETWDHDENLNTPVITRWSSLYSVVESIVTEFDDTLRFGAKLFPKKDAGAFLATGACEVDPGIDVPVAAGNAQAVLDGIPDSEAVVQGGTPMQTGVSEAFDYLLAIPDEYEKAIVLVADGEISCEENFFVVVSEASYMWMDHGIGTYVVGIDVNEETESDLNALATVGGKPSDGEFAFYQTHNQVELQAAFQTIIDDTISCNIPLDPIPDHPELFEVWIGEQKIDEVASCQLDGWMWAGDDFSEITLCGTACQSLKDVGEVEGRYFCVPE